MRSTGAAESADPLSVLRAAYAAFAEAVTAMDDETSWKPTECTGWAVRDLVFHCVGDLQRGLVALHTPAAGPADRDASTYWADWLPATADAGAAARAAAGRRFSRVVASMFLHVGQLRELYLETAAAVLDAAEFTDLAKPVRTQGHVLAAGDLMRTLAVEATIHHLDLEPALPGGLGPAPAGLAETRRTLDGLLGHHVPIETWDDATYARKATGRRALTAAERGLLDADVPRFPLFG